MPSSAIWRSGSCRVRFTMLTPICSSPSTFNQVAGYSDAEPRHVEQDLSHRLDIAQTLAICRSSRLNIAQLHAICRSSPFNGRGYPFVLSGCHLQHFPLTEVVGLLQEGVGHLMREPEPTQRSMWSPARQRFTLRQTVSTMEKDDSITLVLARVRRNCAGMRKRCTVSVSSMPSSRLRAALGFSSISSRCSRSSARLASVYSLMA